MIKVRLKRNNEILCLFRNYIYWVWMDKYGTIYDESEFEILRDK